MSAAQPLFDIGTGAPERPILSAGSAAEVTLSALLKEHADLGLYGYFTPRGQNWRSCREEFDRDRRAVLHASNVDAFVWSRMVLQLGCRHLVSPLSRRSSSSYTLKHIAEYAAASILNRPMYVPNGVLIFAALSLGLKLRRDGCGPNALVAVRTLWRAAE